jgi:hypothetical protein
MRSAACTARDGGGPDSVCRLSVHAIHGLSRRRSWSPCATIPRRVEKEDGPVAVVTSLYGAMVCDPADGCAEVISASTSY